MQLDPEHSNRSYIRFKTQRMSTLFPDMEKMSDWGTPNHYFFEIITKTSHSVYIQMCLNSKNLSAEQKALYDRAIEGSNSRTSANGWIWRTIFRSETVDFEEDLSEQDVAEKLDTALKDLSTGRQHTLQKQSYEVALCCHKGGCKTFQCF